MSDTPCSTTRRLWFLQCSDEFDRESCVVKEKFRTLTLQPIEENARDVIRRNDQIIVRNSKIKVLENVEDFNLVKRRIRSDKYRINRRWKNVDGEMFK